MKVSETVRSIAGEIRASKPTLSARHRVLVELLHLMPLYCEAKQLDAWEGAILAALPKVRDVANQDTSDMGHLLEEIFEFGRFGLYTSFDPAGTAECYGNLSKLLKESGITPPKVFIFTGL